MPYVVRFTDDELKAFREHLAGVGAWKYAKTELEEAALMKIMRAKWEVSPVDVLSEWNDAAPRPWTSAQVEKVAEIFERNPDGETDLLKFASRFTWAFDYIGGEWCGMYLGIELDGHSHT